MAKKKKTRKKSASKLVKIIKSVPGYDPFEDSDGFTFDEQKAQNAIDFFSDYVTHVKGPLARRPYALREWEQAIVANLFGWVDEEGLRRYREALIFVPRKNSKTTLVAGLALLVLFMDNEIGAEIYVAASDKGQASILFNIAKQMVAQDRDLDQNCEAYRSSICIESMGSAIQPVSSDAFSKHGYNAHVVIVDELHAQPNRELVDVLSTSQGARSQPLFISLTTSDYEREGSICNEKHKYACEVRDGILKDSRFLPVIYEATIEDDWKDPKVWKKANPNLGHSFKQEYLERECEKAKSSPAFENSFKRLYLNIRTEQAERVIPMDSWDKCVIPVELSREEFEKSLEGKRCWGGLDLASSRDFTALALMFHDEATGRFPLMMRFWLPEEAVLNPQKDRSDKDKSKIRHWMERGWITTTEGNITDDDKVVQDILELWDRYDIQRIGIDPWSARAICTRLDSNGLEIVHYRQNYKCLSPPFKELDKLIVRNQILHDRNPVLRWMATNTAAEYDHAENMRPSKKKSKEKIDGIVATIMSLGCAMEDVNTEQPFTDREVMVIDV